MFFVPIPRAVAIDRGLKHYSTGKPCNKGNISKRFIKGSKCCCPDCLFKGHAWSRNNPELAQQSRLKYATKNPEKVKESKEKSYVNNRSKILQSQAEYRLANPDLIREIRKRSRDKHKAKASRYKVWYRYFNKELIQKQNLEYSRKNREKISKRMSAYNKKFSELKRSQVVRRRVRLLQTNINMSELDSFVFEESLRLNKLRQRSLSFKWNVDHMIPLQAENVSGLHVWNNFQCLPQVINQSKGNRLIYTNPHEWLYDIPKFFKVVYQQEIAA